MIGYAKIWTSIQHDPWFLSLSCLERGVFLQMIILAKSQGDSGDISAKNLRTFANLWAVDRSTALKVVDKFRVSKKITVEKGDGFVRLNIVNYKKWQGLRGKEAWRKIQEESSENQGEITYKQTRAEQTRAEQSKEETLLLHKSESASADSPDEIEKNHEDLAAYSSEDEAAQNETERCERVGAIIKLLKLLIGKPPPDAGEEKLKQWKKHLGGLAGRIEKLFRIRKYSLTPQDMAWICQQEFKSVRTVKQLATYVTQLEKPDHSTSVYKLAKQASSRVPQRNESSQE